MLPRNEIGGYIQEMVDNRNYIAHGNKTPKEVGRNFTILDLKINVIILRKYVIMLLQNMKRIFRKGNI